MPVKATDIEARIAKAWGRCGVTARGMWLTIRTVIESEENNERAMFMEHAKPVDIQQAAIMARCQIATASRSIDKLVNVNLLSITDKGNYYSPWLASLSTIRKGGAKRVAKFRQKQGLDTNGALRNDLQGRYISQCNTDVTQNPSPPLSPSPDVPLSKPIPSYPPPSFPSPPFSAAAAPPGSAGRKAAKVPAKKAAEPPAEYRQLTDFWQDRWAAAHGGERVPFDRSDGAMISGIWNRVGFDLELAKAVIVAYFADTDRFYEGHPLTLLKRDALKFISRARTGSNGARYGTGKPKPTAEQRGEFAEDLAVPLVGRSGKRD